MPSTDDRVVAMHFDNAAFEHKIAGTIASLDKLKTSLDFTHSQKGLSDLKSAGNNFDLHGMSSAIENISSKFSAMGAVAFSVINSIVQQATQAGLQIANSLSIGPMVGGFQEYETNMNSIQTILANTRSDGTNLDQVSAALEELNLYSDKTIYNFSQMARNIGTFTAAGVSLETSTGAIKGIANLAAVSGSNADQASTAMYQLSQALAAGSVKLMDWNSVVNAGMGGEVFKKALFETGKSLGTIKDVGLDTTFEEWEASGHKFRETLQDGWITADVLTNTLAGFTGDLTEAQILSMGYTQSQAAEIMEMGKVAQEAATKVKTFTQLVGTIKESIGSGWAQTFKIIFGDFEEARTLFTGFSEYFGGLASASAEARNKLLAGWEKMGGRDQLIQSLMYSVKILTDLLTPLKEAFREIFPKKTATDLYRITNSIRNFLRNLLPTEETMENLKRIFKGVFSALDIGMEVIKGIWGVFKALFSTLASASDGKVLAFFAEIGDKIVALHDTLVKGKGIQHFFEDIIPKVTEFATKFIEKFKEILGITKEVSGFFQNGFGGTETKSAEGIEAVANRIGLAASKIKAWITELIENFSFLDDAFRQGAERGTENEGSYGPVEMIRTLGRAFTEVKTFVSEAMTALGNFKDKVVELATSVSDSAGNLFEKIFGKDADGDAKKIEGFGDKISAVGDKLKGFKDKIGELGGKDGPKKVLDGITQSFQDLGDKFGSFDGVADTLQGVWDKIGGGIDGIKDKLSEFISFIQETISGAEETPNKVAKFRGGGQTRSVDKGAAGGDDGGGFSLDAGDAAAGGVLAGILLIFRDLKKLIPDVKGLFKDIGKSVEAVTDVFQAMQLKLKAEALKEIGKAIALITASMVVLSLMDTSALITAATAVGVVVGQLVGAMALLSKFASGPSSVAKIGVMAAAMVGMAGAVLTMSLAAKIMSGIDIEDLAKGVGAIAVLLGALALSANKLQKLDLKGASGLILFGYGLKKIADAVLIFGNMDLLQLAKGMGALVLSLMLLADFTDHLPTTDLLRAGGGIALIALGLNMLAVAVKIFATMGWEEMGKGLIGVAVALGVLVLALNNLPVDMKILAGAGAMVLMAFAIQMLATSLGIIAALATDDMTKALTGLAIALGVLVGAAVLMQYGLAGAAAISVMSVSLSSLAEALVLFANIGWMELLSGLAKLGVALLALSAVAVLLAPASLAIASLGLALIALGAGFALLGAGIWLIGEGFQAIAEAGGKAVPVFMDLVKGLIGMIPEFIGAVADGLLLLAQKILDATPELVSAMTKVISALLDSALELIPKFAKVISKLFIEMLKAAEEVTPEAVKAGFAFLMALLHGIEDNIGEIVTTVANIITNFLDALREKLPQLIESGYQFVKALIKGVIVKLGEIGLEFVPIGLSLLEGIWDGIWAGATWIGDQIQKYLFDPIINAFKWLFGIASPSTVMAEIGLNLLQGLWQGISDAVSWLLDMIGGLISNILGAFTGAITWLVDVGGDILQGLWDGMIAVYTQIGEWLIALPGEVLGFLGDALSLLLDWGSKVIQGLWDGATAVFTELTSWVTGLPGEILGFLGDALGLLKEWGKEIIRGLRQGVELIWDLFKTYVMGLPEKLLGFLGDGLDLLWDWGHDLIEGLWKGAEFLAEWLWGKIKGIAGWVTDKIGDGLDVLKEFGKDLIRGLWNGIWAMKDWIWDKVEEVVGWITDAFGWVADIFSPSRLMMWYGQMLGEGLIVGIDSMQKPITTSSEGMGEAVVDGFNPDKKEMLNKLSSIMSVISDQLNNTEEFNPTITPVLDLTNVEANAARLGRMFGSGTITAANLTSAQTAITAADVISGTLSTSATPVSGVSFTQINNSPEALSTADIYRNTRNQISMAKEELKIA